MTTDQADDRDDGSLSVRLPHPEVPTAAHRLAQQLRREHGDAAAAEAGRRIAACLEAGDEAGAAALTDALFALAQFERLARGAAPRA